MERILVGYDGSEAADCALEWVAQRARQRPLIVDLVAIANPFLSERADVFDVLDKGESRLQALSPGLPIESHCVDGVMPRTLTDSAAAADLLVIGIHRGHSVQTALHGWMPLRVSIRSRAATCLVPAVWTPVEGPVLVGVDADFSSRAAIDFAAKEAAASESTLRLVHASRRQVPERRSLLSDAEQLVRVSYPVLNVETDLIPGDPVAVLRVLAKDCSLVVLGSHQRGVVARGLFGSVTMDLLWEIDSPICVVPNPPASLGQGR